MVLYKRKQVTFVQPPEVPHDLTTRVYVIPSTKEWFLNYEDYLARMDYYGKRKFVCEITGNSCLSFFEALESEGREIKGVERNFPEALREHILRFLQFNRITRLDQLVDKVYLVFKHDYFPGETIFIKTVLTGDSGRVQGTSGSPVQVDEDLDSHIAKQRGTIREKVQYGQSEQTKYLVVRLNDMQQTIVSNDKISRDRNHFTKWLIKTFIKLTMSRSHKVGAPWVVKDKYAKKYRISQEYPDDLKHYADSTPTGETLFEDQHKANSTSQMIPIIASKPLLTKRKKQTTPSKTPKPVKKAKIETENGIKKSTTKNSEAATQERILKFPSHYLPETVKNELGIDEDGIINDGYSPSIVNANNINALQPNKKNITEDLDIKFDIQNSKPQPKLITLPENSKNWNKHLISELKEATEHPNDSETDDEEDTATKVNRIAAERVEKLSDIKRLSLDKLTSIQDALQSWIFINIYHKVLNLDTFTFDDFVYAMGWNLDQFNDLGRCELLDELWCATLSAIVSNTLPSAQQQREAKEDEEIFGLLINLPPSESFINPVTKYHGEDSNENTGSDSDQDEKILKSDDDDSNESSTEDQPKLKIKEGNVEGTPNEDVEVVEDVEDVDGEADDESDGEDELDEENESLNHNAFVVMNHRGTPWHERLRKRNFKDGNWQCILLGVLSLVDYVPAYRPVIERVYRVLAPKSITPTPSTVLNQFYSEMDIDLKFQTLNILVDLLASGNIVRTYIDECLEKSTKLRRNRLDNIKDYKVSLELAQRCNYQIHEALTAHSEKESGIVKDENAPNIIRRPRLNFKAFEMTKQEKVLAEINKDFKATWNTKYEALTKIVQLKKEKREIERELMEIDCQRVKLLGKDRLFNRYWWFENNGLPTFFGGSNDDEDEDEDKEQDKGKNKDKEMEKKDEDKDQDKDQDSDGDDDVLEETYLMGRLWVQGPCKDDLSIYFRNSLQESNKFDEIYHEYEYQVLQELEKIELAKQEETSSELEREVLTQNSIVTENGTIKQENGFQPDLIAPLLPQTEVSGVPAQNTIHEMDFSSLPKPFTKACTEMFGINFKSNAIYRVCADNREELVVDSFGALQTSALIQLLSPFQRKVIEEYPGPLVNGEHWRFYDEPEDLVKLVGWLNPWGKRESQLRKELINIMDLISSSMKARRKALFKDKMPDDEVEIQKDLAKLQVRLEELNAESDSEENSSVGSKRSLRKRAASRKRQKFETVAETLELGDIEDIKKMQDEQELKLKEKRKERDLQRVWEWVNSKALDKFDRSLYDGGDKPKAKGGRKSNK